VCNWNPSVGPLDADLCAANPWGLTGDNVPAGICVACPPGAPCYAIGRPARCVFTGVTNAADCTGGTFDFATMTCYAYAAPSTPCPTGAVAEQARYFTEATCQEAAASLDDAVRSCGVVGKTCADTPSCTAPCPRCVSTKVCIQPGAILACARIRVASVSNVYILVCWTQIPAGEICVGNENTAQHCLQEGGSVVALSTGGIICVHNVSAAGCGVLEGTVHRCSARLPGACVVTPTTPTDAAIEAALGCAVDPLGTCKREDCPSRGTCDDTELSSPYTADGGVCVRAPIASAAPGQLTCASPTDTLGLAGCINGRTTKAACDKVGGVWRRRASTPDECAAVKRCYEPALGLFTGKTADECFACNGASMRSVYTWTSGTWAVRPVTLEWRAARGMVSLNKWVPNPLNETRLAELLRLAVGRRMAAANQNLLACRVGRLAALVRSVACFCGGDSASPSMEACQPTTLEPLASAPLYNSNAQGLGQVTRGGRRLTFVSYDLCGVCPCKYLFLMPSPARLSAY